ncbi:EI24 domain-containing protein [Sphingomonas rubra]|uniref:Uncharacterized protein involved in cysteine biosynthesis n=1 Tax=Sphingomonas rubra TaxID=634430 RepID=A0A1I5U2R2_9SPHN|nr:EI24 domain-containing protein [Sphingomonas rubra]SFP89559.1 Uncharacterized protein involved in cysteine biosynthesis [Sphingomonas rubra]
MIAAFFLSVGQLGDPPVLRVFAKSMAVTLALFALLGAGVWWGTQALIAGWVGGYEDGLAAMVALFGTVLALWLLFRAVAVAVIGLFADEVVAAVEARHYPAALATARPVSFARGAATGLRSAARVVLVNALMLPLYVVLLATGIGTAVAFFAVNAWLLGRDLGDMVASRHLDRAGVRQWRRRTGPRRFLLGLGGTGLFVLPVVNLVAPVLGAAMATHLFHRGRS